MLFEVLVIIILLVGFGSMFFYFKKNFEQQNSSQIEKVVNQVFGMSATKIAEQSRQILNSDKEAIANDLRNKQQVFENLVKDLEILVKDRQSEIRKLEEDRTRKFSEIVKSLEYHNEVTKDLKVSTEALSKVLSNNQERGSWGERIIEDLMIANGLQEGIHFVKQQKLKDTALKPDIMLLLPNKRVVAVDVKFPFQEMQKMSLASNKVDKQSHAKQFELDLKTKINKVAEYINPAAETLDYAIMFVPNEAVFSFINQNHPDIIDLALAKRVLIVSPFTFLIVARTVMESYRNFMIGDKLKSVVRHIEEFVAEWDKFTLAVNKYGNAIGTLQKSYEELVGTRFRVMEKKIEKVKSASNGQLLEAKNAVSDS